MLKLCTFLLLIAGTPLSAQLLNWGVKGGVPLNDAVKAAGTFNPEFHRWTLGPMVELNLPAGFGIEADMLYRRIGYSDTSLTNGGVFDSSAWSFPLLVKYKFPGNLARVYVDAGYSFRALTDVLRLDKNSSQGFVMGGGIRYDLKLIKISPELRYTRWNNDVFAVNAANGNTLNSKKNQIEFLIGVTF
ncbi:MAG: hypothetical protein J0H49_08650 [Acidobacteria bacterium]|nr:hypothetical protein [Acidobacteriota bacterium]